MKTRWMPTAILLFVLLCSLALAVVGPSAAESIGIKSSNAGMISTVFGLMALVVGVRLALSLGKQQELKASYLPPTSFFDLEGPTDGAGRSTLESIHQYQLRLRNFAAKYERQNSLITRLSVWFGFLLISVPLITWLLVMIFAFTNDKGLPNAWLLVVSSTTTGGLGLAVAIAMLRHVKLTNDQVAGLQNRLITSSEFSSTLMSNDLSEDVKSRALSIYVLTLGAMARRIDLATSQSTADPMPQDGVLGELLADALKAYATKP